MLTFQNINKSLEPLDPMLRQPPIECPELPPWAGPIEVCWVKDPEIDQTAELRLFRNTSLRKK